MGQGLGLILLGVVFFLAYSHFQLSSLQSQDNQTIAQVAVVDAQLSKVKRENIPRSKNLVLENSVATMDAEIQSLQQAFDILKKGDIGDTGGYAVFLRAFSRQIVDGVWLTGFNIVGAGNEMSLQGRALRPELVAAYIGRLKNEATLQGKNFSSLDIRMSGPTPAAHSATIPYVEFDLRSPTIGTQLATSSVDLSPAVVSSAAVAPSKSVALAAPIVPSALPAASSLPSTSATPSPPAATTAPVVPSAPAPKASAPPEEEE